MDIRARHIHHLSDLPNAGTEQLDPGEALEIDRLSHLYVDAVQGKDMATAGDLSRQVDGFATRLVADQSAKPRDPSTYVVSRLAVQSADGRTFENVELAGMVRLMLIGGHVVPRNSLCSAAWRMATHPAHVTLLRDDSTAMRGFVEELLRIYPANQALARAPNPLKLQGSTCQGAALWR